MANITRTLTRYKVYGLKTSLVKGDDGQIHAEVQQVCESEVVAPKLYQNAANAVVRDALGVSRKPNDVQAVFEPISVETYAISVDNFLANATLVSSAAPASNQNEEN